VSSASACCLALLLIAVPAPARPPQGEPDTAVLARHAQAAQAAQRAGDFTTAIRELRALARLVPDRADVQSNLGIAYFFHQQPEEALGAFEQALRLDPDLTSALIFSGIAHCTLSQPARAIPPLERAIARNPTDALAQTWLAHSYAAQGRFHDAIDHFLLASQRTPNDVDIWYGLGRAYLQLGREAVTQLAGIAPDGARVAQLAGDLWLLRGEPRNAMLMYREALTRRPGLTELPPMIERLGSQPTHASLPALAPPRAASADPALPEDAHYLAATEYRERAGQAFERIATIDAESYRAHQVLAESLETQERTEEALAEYRAALRVKPDAAGLHLAAGDLLMSVGRAAEALEDYRGELRVRPASAEVYYRMGRAFLVLDQADEAEAALARAAALGDPPPAVQRELGKIALRRGKAADAVRLLATYVDRVTTDATAHYLLMRAYQATGDADAAKRHLAIYERLAERDKQQQEGLNRALALFSGSQGREP
jgi:tetratricopeptide (TPR) repeat protein